MLKNLLILFSLIFICGCAAIKVFHVLKIIKSGEINEQNFKYEIPFEYENGLIILKAKINECEEDKFILDSGAPACLISDSILGKTQMKKILDFDATDVNSKDNMAHWYIADSIKIDRLTFKNTGTVNLKFGNPAAMCLVKSGLIGMNIIDKCIWHFDFANKKIILTSSLDSIKNVKKGIRILLRRDKAGYIYVDFRFNGESPQKILFDLGYADGFISVPMKFFSNHAMDKVIKSYGNGTGGAFSISQDTMHTARVKSISIGEINFANAPLTASKGSHFSFGNKIIQYYFVTLNTKDNEMYLTPIPGKEYSYELQTFGLDFDYTKEHLTIGTLYQNGPAENKGLLPGDTVISINEREIAFTGYCDFFLQRQELLKGLDSVNLKIKRNGIEKNIILHKEKML